MSCSARLQSTARSASSNAVILAQEAIVAGRAGVANAAKPARRSDLAGTRRDVETLPSYILGEPERRSLFAKSGAIVFDPDLGDMVA
jgi:hypothetical protein